MKNFYILILFLVTNIICAQQNNSDYGILVDGIEKIEVQEENLPLNGVELQSTTSDMIEAEPSAGPIIVEDADYTGSSKGQFSVSLTGAATYNFPIEVPPGINGIVPQIGLAYSSQGNNGIAGYGWNISGLSAINKVGSNKFYDGKYSKINFSADDRFVLDGQRLLLKSGVYGMDGAEYQTESYSNLKITSHGTLQSNYGPEYFKVQYPDGSIAYYGRTYDGIIAGRPGAKTRTNIVYALTYTTNPQNVVVKYNYINDNGNLLISSISYGYRSTNPLSYRFSFNSENSISFSYKNRNRVESGYVFNEHSKTTKILDKITVHGFAEPFRVYQLTYKINSLGYEQLQKITETSGDTSLSKSPVTFLYGADLSSGSIVNEEIYTIQDNFGVGFSKLSSLNSKVLTGDFSGSGDIGFLMMSTSVSDGYKQIIDGSKLYVYNPSDPTDPLNQNKPLIIKQNFASKPFLDVVTSKKLNHSNVLLPNLGWTTITENGTVGDGVSYIFNSYVYIPGTSITVYQQGNPITATMYGKPAVRRQFLSGDFNGDGITEIIRMEHSRNFDDADDNQYSTGVEILDTTTGAVYATPNIPIGFNYQVLDVDGDGYDEFIVIRHQNIRIYKFNLTTKKLYLYSDQGHGDVNYGKPVYVGDFNGDGKMDFVTPQSPEKKEKTSNKWIFYINKDDGSFNSFGLNVGITYNMDEKSYYSTQEELHTSYNYIFTDINNDGKTDLIKTLDKSLVDYYGNERSSYLTAVYTYENLKFDAELQDVSFQLHNGTHQLISHTNRFPIIVSSNFNQKNYKTELALITDNKLKILKSNKDNSKTKALATINEFDITTKINYNVYDEGKNTRLGISDKSEDAVVPFDSFRGPLSVYPKTDVDIIPGMTLVTKVTYDSQKRLNIGENTTARKQLFTYADATMSYDGRGFLGFRGRMVTNIYQGGPSIFELDDQVKHVSIYDLDNNGLVTEEYIANGIDWANFFTTPVNYITKKVNTYNISTSANKVFKAQNTQTINNEGLTGVQRTIITSFDNYSNALSIKETVSGAGDTSVLSTAFEYVNNNVNDNYFIGRASSKTLKMNNVQTSKEVFTYVNNLLTKVGKYGEEGSPELLETNEFDVFGNVIRKTISAQDIQPRIASYVYDTSGRYLEKSTDTEGLETNYLYDKNNGWLVSKTNPFGFATVYGYNSLGMLRSETDYLGNTKHIAYKTNGFVILSGPSFVREEISYPDGRKERKTTNAWGYKTQDGFTDIDGNWINTSYSYDSQGRLIKKSEPFTSTASLFTSFEYDKYGRVIKTVLPTGREIISSYNGLSTSIDDGVKIRTETKNSKNQISKIIDNGETVNYNYNPNGTLSSTNYGGNVISFEYDKWGRKTKMTDPSAGTYNYEYNSIGDLLKEITPNGTTTHIYDSTGKIQNTSYANTNISYIYNDDKLLDKITTSTDHGNYEERFVYDNYKRVTGKRYQTPHSLVYIYNNTFDQLGRVLENSKTVIGFNGQDVLKTKNVYKNGYLWKLQNGLTNTDLKVYNSFNERGQVTDFTLANGLTENLTYDQFGYLTKNAANNSSGNLFTLSNSWDVQRGNLKNRSNTLFYGIYNEFFSYDSHDRLTNIDSRIGNNPFNPGVEEIQYDSRGRIIKSKVGDYNYDSNKIYQLQNIENLNDLQYYQNNPLQEVTYNTHKAPLTIKQQGNENIYFEYDGFNNRTAMYYGNEAANKSAAAKVRYYSPGGDIEVDFDKITNKYTINIYVDGDPYSTSIIQRRVDDATAFYYLHRDYLGSIVAITNNTGSIIEKRHFDAWGNVLMVQNGQNNNLSKLTFLDRGYTGHEHLQGVGLINMNARLYDPKLHRFLAPDSIIQDPGNPQNYNLYGYVYNNPLRFTDPTGNYAIIDDVAAAIIGGAINLGVNIYQGNLKGSVWDMIGQGAAAFGAGAVAGTLSLYGPAGWVAGGAIVGGTNAWLSGDNITQGAIMGGVTGLVGGALGSYISSGISVAIQGINISSPVLQGTLGGALGGGFTGGIMNSGLIGIQTGSFSQAIDGFGSGFAMGFVTGSISGASASYRQATKNNISPWNGKSAGAAPSGSAMVEETLAPAMKRLNASIDKAKGDYQNSLLKSETSLTEYYPRNNGALGNWDREFLMPGMKIDRFGTGFGKYFSPQGTPMSMRALPPGNTGAYNAFEVVKPFEVRSSTIAPAFGQSGLGKQYLSPVSMNILLKRGIITPINN